MKIIPYLRYLKKSEINYTDILGTLEAKSKHYNNIHKRDNIQVRFKFDKQYVIGEILQLGIVPVKSSLMPVLSIKVKKETYGPMILVVIKPTNLSVLFNLLMSCFLMYISGVGFAIKNNMILIIPSLLFIINYTYSIFSFNKFSKVYVKFIENGLGDLY